MLKTKQATKYCSLFLQVLYKEKGSGAEPQVQFVKGNLTQSALLRNLLKYVQYKIQVLAFTRIGDGQLNSPPVLERTKDDGERHSLKYCIMRII